VCFKGEPSSRARGNTSHALMKFNIYIYITGMKGREDKLKRKTKQIEGNRSHVKH
jgi:hypothetical protein